MFIGDMLLIGLLALGIFGSYLIIPLFEGVRSENVRDSFGVGLIIEVVKQHGLLNTLIKLIPICVCLMSPVAAAIYYAYQS